MHEGQRVLVAVATIGGMQWVPATVEHVETGGRVIVTTDDGREFRAHVASVRPMLQVAA